MQLLTFVSSLDPSVHMWQKSRYFCLTSLNQLLKTVEVVDDLSNSDNVKSIVTGSESQMGTSWILLMAISKTSIFASFNNFLQYIKKRLWLNLYLRKDVCIWNWTQHHELDFLDWLLVRWCTVELTFLCEFPMEVHGLQHTGFQQVKSEMLQGWGGGLHYGQDLA